jgi:hypothetical protein
MKYWNADDKMADGGMMADGEFEIVVISKELQKDGAKLIFNRYFISAENEQEAKKKAVEMWEEDMGNSDLHILNVMTDSLYSDSYLAKNDNLPFADGGEIDTFSNIFLSYGFTQKRGSYGIKFFEKTIENKKIYGSVDIKNGNITIEDEYGKMYYQGFSVSKVIETLNSLGLTDGGMMAKGGNVGVKEYKLVPMIPFGTKGFITPDYNNTIRFNGTEDEATQKAKELVNSNPNFVQVEIKRQMKTKTITVGIVEGLNKNYEDGGMMARGGRVRLIFHGSSREIDMGEFESAAAAKRYVKSSDWERPYSIKKLADGGMMADGGEIKTLWKVEGNKATKLKTGTQRAINQYITKNKLDSRPKGENWGLESWNADATEQEVLKYDRDWYADGGVATAATYMVKYHMKDAPKEIKEKLFTDKDKAELFYETLQEEDDIVVMPIVEVKPEVKAQSKPKSLFASAKPAPATAAAKKKRERVQVDGISDDIRRYDELKAVINNAEAEKEIIGGKLKEIGRDKFLDIYEDTGRRPANFDLADGNENILLEVTDKYLKVEPEKAAILEKYDGLLEVVTTYEFNKDVLEKKVSDDMTVGDVVSMLIQDSKLLSDSDKENLIKAKTTMRVPKGTLDRLMDYDNPREVFNLIAPVLALK